MILKGQKVILRPVELSDAPRFVKWFNDPAVNKFLAKRSMSLTEEKKFIYKRLHGKQEDVFFSIETLDGELIGNTTIRKSSREVHEHVGSLGIVIGEKRYWNQGFGSEVMRLLIEYGFKKLKLHRIELDVYSYNPRAFKVYRRLGFKKEGTKREHVKFGNKYYDVIHMGLLDREWKSKNL